MKSSCSVWAVWWNIRCRRPRFVQTWGCGASVAGVAAGGVAVAGGSAAATGPAGGEGDWAPGSHANALRRTAAHDHREKIWLRSSMARLLRLIRISVRAGDPVVLGLEVLHDVQRVLLTHRRPKLAAQLPLDPAEQVELRVVRLHDPVPGRL